MLEANLAVLVGTLACAVPALAGHPSQRQPAGKEAKPTTPADPSPKAPVGFLEMFVAGVVPSPDGHTLVLVNAEEQVLLPLGIGLTEALSIHGRLERKRAARPLTHDLLDQIMRQLGGEVVRVQIDDLRDNVFIGTLFIKKDGRVISVDARPSDAVALALGNRAPIFVARPVVDRAAIHSGDLPNDEPRAPPPPTPTPIFSL